MPEVFGANYTEYQSNRNRLRKLVRRAYLKKAQENLIGPTLDFGCGIGELLGRLPEGSVGAEYNQATVELCRKKGMDVRWYDGSADGWKLTPFSENDAFRSMVISHVLEHLDAPMDVLRSLLHAARRLDMQRVLVIVPGRAGFKIDPTHRTFVDRSMLTNSDLIEATGFSVSSVQYFPGNWGYIGRWFPHHELQVLFTRSPE